MSCKNLKTKKISPKSRAQEEFIEIKKQIDNLQKNNLLNTYLGNKGYSIYKICLNRSIIDYIKKELTVKPFVQNSMIDPTSFPVYQESDKKIYVPRFWGIKVFGYPKLIKINDGNSIDLKFNPEYKLRDYQNIIVDSYLKAIHLKTDNQECYGASSALIELKCGGGKTVLALKIIELVKKKTIIFVHKTFLKNQWIERIQQFLPNAKIGTIQGQIIDIDDKDIVIAMVQSISMKSYPESLFDSFGLSIFDEVHHMSSEVFSNCLKKCNTYYGLGLSATMNRKDGLTNVFKMYLGEICYKNTEDTSTDDVLVKTIDYIVDDEEYNEVERDFRGNIKYSTMISKISNFTYRSDFIINIIEHELVLNNDQQIILLAHNKSLLNYIYKSITQKNTSNLSIGFYIGGMKEADLKISETNQLILATYAMAAEALDIKSLTTLILATPKTDIVQAVGRILRQKHSQPLIIDIVDNQEPFLNQFQKRRAFYNEKGYKIIRTNNTKYIDSIIKFKKEDIDDETIWNEVKPRSKSKYKSKSNSKIDNDKDLLQKKIDVDGDQQYNVCLIDLI
jgi:superfamily II DNA or RNA helicase